MTYGLVDVFIQAKHFLAVRNDDANGWIKARSTRLIKQGIKADAKPLDEVLKIWFPEKIQEDRLLEFIPKPGADEEPHLSWHMTNSTTAGIDNFYIPLSQRGKGAGRIYYQQWEKGLPPVVQHIELWAKNADAVKFWMKLGFVFKYPHLQDDEDNGMMKKDRTLSEALNMIADYVIKDDKTYRTFVDDGKKWSSRETDGKIFPDYQSAEQKKNELQKQFPKRRFFTQMVGNLSEDRPGQRPPIRRDRFTPPPPPEEKGKLLYFPTLLKAIVWDIDTNGNKSIKDILPFESNVSLEDAQKLVGEWYPDERYVTFEKYRRGVGWKWAAGYSSKNLTETIKTPLFFLRVTMDPDRDLHRDFSCHVDDWRKEPEHNLKKSQKALQDPDTKLWCINPELGLSAFACHDEPSFVKAMKRLEIYAPERVAVFRSNDYDLNAGHDDEDVFRDGEFIDWIDWDGTWNDLLDLVNVSINESQESSPTLYHGTSPESAQSLVTNGWQPNKHPRGGNMGDPRYLYLTTGIEDAKWFAKGSVVEVKAPLEHLIPDPEDASADTVEEELTVSKRTGLPAKLALTRPLGPEHFRIVK